MYFLFELYIILIIYLMTTYSIIIPTRDRHETLYHTLRSVLSLVGNNLEVIVSDNYSSEHTKNVVNQFTDHRLVYSRTDERISMVANFERGIRLSQGDFVTIIGDDDFIVPSAWNLIKPVLKDIDVVTWFRYSYYWNNFPEASGMLYASLSKSVVKQNSCQVLNAAIKQFLNYQFLPSFYNSWISRSLINKLIHVNQKYRISDYIFPKGALSPDVYSSLQLLLVSDCFLFSTLPFTVSGISTFSNGMGPKYGNRDSQVFMKESGYKSQVEAVHPILSELIAFLEKHNLNTMQACIASDYFALLDNYKPIIAPSLSKIELLATLLKRMGSTYSIPEHLVREMTEIVGLDDTSLPSVDTGKDFEFFDFYGVKSNTFTVDTRKWGAKNVYDAMILYEKFLSGTEAVDRYDRYRYWNRLKKSVKPVLKPFIQKFLRK
ncbi:MAG: glycosyltransferase family 2 protein [Pseudanabaenaceae cyanobacterium]